MGLFAHLKNRLTARQIKGKLGEDAALGYLQAQGLSLLERNFRCRGGEIDLIMQDKNTLVFVEVRLRTHRRYGGAAESVIFSKQNRLILAAQLYLQRYRTLPATRFDVIAIEIEGEQLNWLKNVIEN